jgi:hypothetical protein
LKRRRLTARQIRRGREGCSPTRSHGTNNTVSDSRFWLSISHLCFCRVIQHESILFELDSFLIFWSLFVTQEWKWQSEIAAVHSPSQSYHRPLRCLGLAPELALVSRRSLSLIRSRELASVAAVLCRLIEIVPELTPSENAAIRWRYGGSREEMTSQSISHESIPGFASRFGDRDPIARLKLPSSRL